MKVVLLCLFVLVTMGCENTASQQGPLAALQEMRTSVHAKSQDYDVPPKVLSGFRPAYPGTEAQNRESGFVVIICTIGIDGRAQDFEVETMTNPAFAYEAVHAIAKWRWSPALKNGRPVPQKVRVPMNFRGA